MAKTTTADYNDDHGDDVDYNCGLQRRRRRRLQLWTITKDDGDGDEATTAGNCLGTCRPALGPARQLPSHYYVRRCRRLVVIVFSTDNNRP